MQSELPKASKATTGQSGSIGKHDLAYGCGMASTKNNVMRQSHCANPYIYIYSYKHIYIYICIYVNIEIQLRIHVIAEESSATQCFFTAQAAQASGRRNYECR